jgi:hypothetical protein
LKPSYYGFTEEDMDKEIDVHYNGLGVKYIFNNNYLGY